MNKEHKEVQKSIINFALNCSDYLTLSEAFSVPYQYRILIYDMIKKRAEKNNAK